MPWSARRPCRKPGCAALAVRGGVYCEAHREMERDRVRGTAAERGYDKSWQRASKSHLKRNPLYEQCRREGKLTAATVVDHIRPHRGDKRLFWDASNWQSLCKTCHDRKTARGE